jgi:hypothetical protein
MASRIPCFYMLIGTFYGMFLIVKYLKVFYGVTFYGPQTFIYIFIDVVVKVFARPYHVDELYAFMVFMMFGSLSAGHIYYIFLFVLRLLWLSE